MVARSIGTALGTALTTSRAASGSRARSASRSRRSARRAASQCRAAVADHGLSESPALPPPRVVVGGFRRSRPRSPRPCCGRCSGRQRAGAGAVDARLRHRAARRGGQALPPRGRTPPCVSAVARRDLGLGRGWQGVNAAVAAAAAVAVARLDVGSGGSMSARQPAAAAAGSSSSRSTARPWARWAGGVLVRADEAPCGCPARTATRWA